MEFVIYNNVEDENHIREMRKCVIKKKKEKINKKIKK
jgi:hypothetical protein